MALEPNLDGTLGDYDYGNVDFEAVLRDYTEEFTTPLNFRDRNIMFEWAREKGEENGFVIVIGRSDNGSRNSAPRMSLVCERWGTYKEKLVSLSLQESVVNQCVGKKKKNRESGTKKCDCKFRLDAKQVNKEGEWQLKVRCGFHNHPIAQSMLGHSYAGRLRNLEKDFVKEKTDVNSKPKDILAGLKVKFPKNNSVIKRVYNARLRDRAVEYAGLSQLQQLMFKLNEHGYHYDYRECKETGVIKELFFAHPESIKLLKAFPYILFMDCTYKTNRYNLPLLEIVGVTSTNMSFLVAVVYLEAEKEGNYTWALEVLKSMMDVSTLPSVIVTNRVLALMNAIRETFPTTSHLLCRWHIGKNIVAKCKKMFKIKEDCEKFITDWNVVVNADTEEEFNNLIQRLSDDFSNYSDAVQYVMVSWIVPYKERFVSCWTNKIMHFNNLTTNRVETQHALLKKQLQSSQGAFETCWKQIHKLIECSHVAIIASFEKSRTIVHHKFKQTLWSEIRGMVSIDAMELICNSLNSLCDGIRDPTMCGCAIRTTCGLPCPHDLVHYTSLTKPIPLERVHGFWRKLDNLPIMSCDEDDIEEEIRNRYKECLVTLDSRFEKASRTAKRMIVRRLTEMSHPETTMMNEPEVKTNNKGRPKGKNVMSYKSTKRDPSAFEYVEAIPDNVFFNSQDNQCSPIRQHMPTIPYLNQMPLYMRDYIERTIDVRGDGNCGFRAIAELLGRGTDQWRWVRGKLYMELNAHRELYAKLFIVNDRIEKVLDVLHWYDDECGPEHWFEVPKMGHIVANAFNIGVVSLSTSLSLTFLPSRRPISPKPKLISIAHVNGDHYIGVILKERCPLPPLTYKWHDARLNCATPWLSYFQDRFVPIISNPNNVINV